MNSVKEIVNVALLGTANRRVKPDAFPEDLRADVEQILASSGSYEDSFLKAASMAFAYRNSGMQPLKCNPADVLPECQPDNLNYIPDTGVSLIIYLCDNGLDYLMRYALWYFAQRRLILPHYSLPYFVNLAYRRGGKYMHQYRFAVWPLLGNRGKWLVENLQLGTERFADSSHQLRLRMFVAMRKAGFRKSAAQLSNIWPICNAKQQKEFLSVFMRVYDEDLDFLWTVFNSFDTCRDIVLDLLSRNGNSKPVTAFMEALDSCLRIDGRRHCDFGIVGDKELLSGMGLSATGSAAKYPDFISKLPENEAIVFKLIHSVPLSFWMRKLDCDAAAAVKFLCSNPAFKLGFDFRSVISRFQDGVWAVEFCIFHSRFFPDFLPFLDKAQLERVAEYCDFDSDFRINEKMCGNVDNFEPWGNLFSNALLRFLIRTRNVDSSSNTAQYLAIKLAKSADVLIDSYIQDNYGNDVVVQLLMRVVKYRRNIRSIIG